jgi:hypothetical protein
LMSPSFTVEKVCLLMEIYLDGHRRATLSTTAAKSVSTLGEVR